MLILASTSRYRAELLSRLGLAFETRAPGVDESSLPGEAPAAMALRLALAKARAVAAGLPAGLVIGSDQVAHCAGQVLGKPGNAQTARAQLLHMSGRTTRFDTALALVDASAGTEQSVVVSTDVELRTLSGSEIDAYLRIDEPWDCAGSARSEGLGVVLMKSISGPDPTALVGLPLIELSAMLRRAGLDPLARP
ncbi:MAG: Maf family protein [Burkholderiales bacterium]